MTFAPRYAYADSILDAAIRINALHEPNAVDETANAIQKITELTDANVIIEMLIRLTHQHICLWLPNPGVYRSVNVEINGSELPFWLVAPRMSRMHPFIISPTLNDGMLDLQEWYESFREIHPFIDGNDRVGGAIIAGVSLRMFDKILIPDGV